MLRLVVVLLLFPFTALLYAEQGTQSASEAMQAGNYAIAYCLWQPQAEAGDSVAQYNIGWMYHNGYGLVIDDKQAQYWWQLAAEQGHTEAQFALAMLYTQGTRQIKKSMEDAIPYYLEAAHAGHEDARLVLRSLFVPDDKLRGKFAPQLNDEDWALLGTKVRIKSNRANLRRDATVESDIITTLDQGQELVEVARQKKWIQVIKPGEGISGWMHASLLEEETMRTPPPAGPYSGSAAVK